MINSLTVSVYFKKRERERWKDELVLKVSGILEAERGSEMERGRLVKSCLV